MNYCRFKVITPQVCCPHEQCRGPHPSHHAILERKILKANATTTSFYVKVKDSKSKNRDVFISDSRIPANIFL